MGLESLPPGPSLGPLRQTLRFARDPCGFQEECARRHGDLFTLRLLAQPPTVYLGSPEGVKELLAQSPRDFRAGEGAAVLRFLLGPRSLTCLDGEPHSRDRKLMMPPLHGERLLGYGARMRELTARIVKNWRPGEPVSLVTEAKRITLEVFLDCVVGIPEGPTRDRFRALLLAYLDLCMRPVSLAVWSLLPGEALRRRLTAAARLADRLPGPLQRSLPLALARVVRDLDATILEYIAAKRRQPDAGDVISQLITARDENGVALTDAELHDEMLTLLVGGHETTATSLAFALQEIALHPEVHERILAECKVVLGEGGLDPAHVKELGYLEATVKEALRLHPIAPGFLRKLARPMRFRAYELPQGTGVAGSMHLVHRHPTVWPEPGRFVPERFLGLRPKPYEYFPFGGGVRTCIGMAFGLFEMKIVLATILARLRLELVGAPAEARLHGVLWGASNAILARARAA